MQTGNSKESLVRATAYIATLKLKWPFIIVFCCMFFSFFMSMAGYNVLNNLQNTYEEIVHLEKNNLLDNPPSTTSESALSEIKLLKNSKNLEEYINQTHNTVKNWSALFMFFFYIFCILLFLKCLKFIFF